MNMIFPFICFVYTLNGYISETVALWDVNKKNEERRVTLFGDRHDNPGTANADQYAAILQTIQKRASNSHHKPLSILLEQVPAFAAFCDDHLLLHKLSRRALEGPQIAPGVLMENIEMRGVDIMTSSLLKAGRNIRDDLKELEDIEFEDCDSVCKPLEITVDDLFTCFEKRKAQIAQKSRALNIHSFMLPYFEGPDHHMRLLERDLKELSIDHSDRIVDIVARDEIRDQFERLQYLILHAFAPLFDLNAVCRVREIGHERDIILFTGALHMQLISYLLRQTGAWDISPRAYPSSASSQHLAPISGEHLDILDCNPSYITYLKIKCYQYAQLAQQCLVV